MKFCVRTLDGSKILDREFCIFVAEEKPRNWFDTQAGAKRFAEKNAPQEIRCMVVPVMPTDEATAAMHRAYRLLDSVAYVSYEGDSADVLSALSEACARLGRPIDSNRD